MSRKADGCLCGTLEWREEICKCRGNCYLWITRTLCGVAWNGTTKSISARELRNKKLPPPRYGVAELLPQGLSLLASPPKYGKSWFVLDLCLSVAAGTQFLGCRTVKIGCLYLALEDSERRLQERTNKILGDKDAPEGFDYRVFNSPPWDWPYSSRLFLCRWN